MHTKMLEEMFNVEHECRNCGRHAEVMWICGEPGDIHFCRSCCVEVCGALLADVATLGDGYPIPAGTQVLADASVRFWQCVAAASHGHDA